MLSKLKSMYWDIEEWIVFIFNMLFGQYPSLVPAPIPSASCLFIMY